MVSPGKFPAFLFLAGALLFLAACSPAATPPAGLATPAVEPIAVADFRAASHPDNALMVEVNLTLSRPAAVLIEYENEYAGRFRTPLSEPAESHTIPLLRLRAETTYRYRIGIAGRDGAIAFAETGEFTTGPLPDILADMQAEVTGRSTQPLLLADYSVTYPDRTTERYILLWDDLGHIVWYYANNPDGPLAAGDTGSLHASQRRPNGNLIYMIRNCCIREITPLGLPVWELAEGNGNGIPHHALLPLAEGRMLYLSDAKTVFDDSANGGAAATTAVFDELRLYAPASGSNEPVWSALDTWDIANPGQRREWNPRRRRWTHANSLVLGAGGNIIITLRNRNQIISLSPDFQSIEWQLNGPDSDYAFPNAADRFYRQHTAAQLPNDHILLFDNGNDRPAAEGGLYSQALELRLDAANKTAVKVWEYRSDPDLYSWIISSAYRLANGNTLVNFGATADWAAISLVAVEVDPAGKEVFRMETIDPPRAERADLGPRRAKVQGGIPSLLGETQLRPAKAMSP